MPFTLLTSKKIKTHLQPSVGLFLFPGSTKPYPAYVLQLTIR
jgi:hypothetical protein